MALRAVRATPGASGGHRAASARPVVSDSLCRTPACPYLDREDSLLDDPLDHCAACDAVLWGYVGAVVSASGTARP